MEHRINSSYSVQKAEYEEFQARLSNYLIWSEVFFKEFLR